MRFLKKFFQTPEERIKDDLSELEIGDKAINLAKTINEEDFRLVVEIAEEMINEGELNGRLIGRKSWFLPNANSKLSSIWEKLEKGPVDLDEIADQWEINAKRVYIALEEYATEKEIDEPQFLRDDRTLYLYSFLRTKWYDAVSSMDEDEEATFDNLLEKMKVHSDIRRVIKKEAEKWMKTENSTYVLGNDNVVRPRRIIVDLLEDKITELFEEGKDEISYEELSNLYGVSRKFIGKKLQFLVDNKKLGEVTLYPLDEKIKPRL